MMKHLLIGVATLVCSAPLTSHAIPPEWCVRIFVDEQDDYVPESMGSGTLISPSLVVTNNHVVELAKKSDKSVTVMFPDWTIAKSAKVVATSVSKDLAIIRIAKTKRKALPLGVDPRAGDKATLHGYGFGIYAKGEGLVTGTVYIPDVGEMDRLADMPARFGDSGGPIVANNTLIGVTSRTDGEATYFLVQSEVRKLLAKVK